MKRAPLLPLYRVATRLAAPLAAGLLAARAARAREDPARLGERFGRASLPRPEGPLVWLHGASIGESLVLLPLVKRLIARGLNALVTTGTTSSAAVLADRMPAGALHQFVPLDAPQFVDRFLDHWRPDLLVLSESELWPNIIGAMKRRGAPVAVVNARISPRSFKRWRRAPRAAQALLQEIDVCVAQSQADAARLIHLGAPRVQVAGNLKFDTPAPPADHAELGALAGEIGARPVWVAASTHPGEEEICLAAHVALRERFPDLLTIVAPRDARRGPAIAARAAGRGLAAGLRSAGARPGAATQIYVADTFGEMGLWYRLANVVFVGNSLNGGRGQNPIEPIRLGGAVLHGPSVEAFADAYDALDSRGGALGVADASTLAAALDGVLSDAAALRAMARAGQSVVEDLTGATERVLQALEPYIVHLKYGDRH